MRYVGPRLLVVAVITLGFAVIPLVSWLAGTEVPGVRALEGWQPVYLSWANAALGTLVLLACAGLGFVVSWLLSHVPPDSCVPESPIHPLRFEREEPPARDGSVTRGRQKDS